MAIETTTRPEYVIAVTQNSPGKMLPGVQTVQLRGSRSGKPGNKAEGAEVVARSQSQGSDEGYNWIVDTDGTIYELTGWERAAPNSEHEYVICLAQPMPADPLTEAQYTALNWLMSRLEAKKNIAGRGYSSSLGPAFLWDKVGL